MAKKPTNKSKSGTNIEPSVLTVIDDVDIFGDFFTEEKVIETNHRLDEIALQPTTPKIDMFCEFEFDGERYNGALDSIINQDRNYLTNMPCELKKKYCSLILMKFISNPSRVSEETARRRLIDVNDFVNVDMFMLGAEHSELHHLLMCVSTLETKSSKWHGFIKTHKTEIHSIIKQYYPNLNKQELDIFVNSMDLSDFKEFLKTKGLQESEIKAHVKSWKNEIEK